MEIKATCQICGGAYIKRNGKSLYCSDDCKKEAAKRRYARDREKRLAQTREWKKKHPNYNQEWYAKHPNYDRDRWREIRGTTVEKRACIICGKEFETAIPHKITCSDKCKKERRSRREKERGRKITTEEYHEKYIKHKYGSEEKRQEHLKAIEKKREEEKKARRKKKEEERLARMRVGKCIVCGEEYKTMNPSQKTCSSKCGKKLSYSRKQKRIPKSQMIDNDITLEALYRRDSGVCYLCGEKCDWDDKNENFVGPNYPSIDHIIPVSRGGFHSWNNVRLAHFLCNVNKSDSMIDEAEKLIPVNAYMLKRDLPPRKKVVEQYTKDGKYIQRFVSTVEAEKQTGVKCKGIQKCARGEVKTYNGYVWRYEA